MDEEYKILIIILIFYSCFVNMRLLLHKKLKIL